MQKRDAAGIGKRNRTNVLLKIGRRWMKKSIGLFYPEKCVMCGRILEDAKTGCCATCRSRLPFVREPMCYKCGKPLEQEEQEYCMDCTKKTHFFVRAVALWSYDEQVKRAVYRFKYKNHRNYAEYFAQEIARHYGRMIRSWQPDILVPVPIHRKRYRKRGFNQAQLVATHLSKVIHVPVCTDGVRRIRNTRPQKELNDKERQKNLKSAFIINENSVKLKNIVLVDDIYTTGATVDAITQLLLQAGAKQVYVVTICIGRGY